MRSLCVALALLGMPAIAAAQHQPRTQPRGAAAPVWVAGARPVGQPGSMGSIGLPLPPIGLPLPPIGLPPSRPSIDQRWPLRNGIQHGGYPRGGDPRNGQFRDGQGRGPGKPFRYQHQGSSFLYLTPPYPYYPFYGVPSADVIVPATNVPGVITVVPEPPTGRLIIEVEPVDILQVFVDGEYVGTPADLGSVLDLRPGSWRIEFRAPGYRTLTIDAQIVSQRSIVYRASLERIAPTRVVPPPPAPAAPPAPPFTPSGNRMMYLIPGCYMGNVAPQDLKLPAGCDLSKLTTITP